MKSAHIENLSDENISKKFIKMDILLKIILVLLLLLLFLSGIKVLESSFAFTGNTIVNKILSITSNPFLSLIAGMFATVLVQSSSVTTSIIVGLVSAGTLDFTGAIPMIMGANIGTTVTNTIVSMGHIKKGQHFEKAFAAATVHDFFNILSVLVLLPLELMYGFLGKISLSLASMFYGTESLDFSYSSPLKKLINPIAKTIQDFFVLNFNLENMSATITLLIVAGLIIFFTLAGVVSLMNSLLGDNTSKIFTNEKKHNVYLSILIGMLVTIAVQSSSITTSLLVPLAAANILRLDRIYALTIGANIGTTTTALLASLSGNMFGLAIALVHMLFNIFGMVIWFIHPKMRIVPVKCAMLLSKGVHWNKLIGPLYVILIFFALPLICLSLSL